LQLGLLSLDLVGYVLALGLLALKAEERGRELQNLVLDFAALVAIA
jgi:hypothetical protein